MGEGAPLDSTCLANGNMLASNCDINYDVIPSSPDSLRKQVSKFQLVMWRRGAGVAKYEIDVMRVYGLITRGSHNSYTRQINLHCLSLSIRGSFARMQQISRGSSPATRS